MSLLPGAHHASRQALESPAQTAPESHDLPLGVATVDTRQSQGVAEGSCWQVAWRELRSRHTVRPGAPRKPPLLWTPPVPAAPLPVCALFCIPSILLVNPMKADCVRSLRGPTLWLQEVKNTFPFLLAEARAWGGHGAGVAPCLPGGSQAGLEPSLSLVESPNLAWPFTCKRNVPSGVLSPGSVGLKPAHPPVPGRTKFPLGLQPI